MHMCQTESPDLGRQKCVKLSFNKHWTQSKIWAGNFREQMFSAIASPPPPPVISASPCEDLPNSRSWISTNRSKKKKKKELESNCPYRYEIAVKPTVSKIYKAGYEVQIQMSYWWWRRNLMHNRNMYVSVLIIQILFDLFWVFQNTVLEYTPS